MKIKHRWLCLSQLNGGDSHGPDVALLVVSSLPLNGCDLRGHPVRRADERLALHQQGLCELGRYAKVSCEGVRGVRG